MKDNWRIVLISVLPQDIYLAQSLLESEGIETILKDELTAQVHNFYSNAIGGVKLLVREDEHCRASALLKDAGYILPESLEEKALETIRTSERKHCPYCHSKNIRKNKKGDPLMLVFYVLLGALFPVFKPTYVCFDCSREWRFKKEQ